MSLDRELAELIRRSVEEWPEPARLAEEGALHDETSRQERAPEARPRIGLARSEGQPSGADQAPHPVTPGVGSVTRVESQAL